MAGQRKRFGSPRLHILLKREGLVINHKRTERIYREEGLALRRKRRRKGAAGVQFVAGMLVPEPVIPALNTRFIGVTTAEGNWSEKCRACGNCLLADYGGICPITMCAKSLVNGPCGGYKDGKCETSNERDCAWIMIYERLKKMGRLDSMREISDLKDYSAQSHPARYVNEAYTKAEITEPQD